MSTIDDSELQIVPHLPRTPARSSTDAAASKTSLGDAGLWLNGDVLACACPDCRAPMSVRVWLGIADCWRCSTSIELTPEQEREAARLLAARTPVSAPVRPAPAEPKPKPRPAPVVLPAPPKLAPPKPAPPVQPKIAPPLLAPPMLVPPRPALVPPRVYQSPEQRFQLNTRGDFYRDLPAWLTSIAVHLLLLIGMLMYHTRTPRIAAGVRDAEDRAQVVALVAARMARAQANNAQLTPAEREAKQLAQTLTAGDDRGHAPPLGKVLATLTIPNRERMFDARDPRVRELIVSAEGGNLFTEAAVAEGLRWMSQHQAADGRWTLDHFAETGDCRGRCNGAGGHSDTAGTALGLLPLLGAGQTQQRGIYRENVDRGLHWLVDNQLPTGDLRGQGMGRMYAHGLATLVLCEALGMTGDSWLREPAQQAVDFIVRAQHADGGWRYEPGQAGDTSVVGWELMALRSGKMAGLRVPELCFDRANRFLNAVQSGESGGLYAYEPGRKPSVAMIAEGLLSRQYLGWPADHPGLQEGIDDLLSRKPPRPHEIDMYAVYYATQVVHHVGGPSWQRWNQFVRQALLDSRDTSGHAAGSWPPSRRDPFADTGGRLYSTSLAICTLEVYYRYLPLYRPLDVQ